MSDSTVYTIRKVGESPAFEQWPGWFAVCARDDMQRALRDDDGRGSTIATDFWARQGLTHAKVVELFDAMRAPLSSRLFYELRHWFDERGWLDDAGHDGTRYSLARPDDDGEPLGWACLTDDGGAAIDREWTAARVAEQAATRDGMLELDADFADLLEGIHSETGKRYRDKASNALAQGIPAAWARWTVQDILPEQIALTRSEFIRARLDRGRACKAVEWLALALWHGEVKSARDGFQPTGIQQSSGLYAGMGKPVAAVSWAFGVPGEPIEVDGESYGATPRRALVPRVQGIITKGPPAERTLGLEPMTDTPLALQIAGGAASEPAIKPLASKLAFLASVLCYRPGAGLDYSREGTLGDLAKALFHGKRVQKRDLQAAARAVAELDALMVLYGDNTVERLFQNRWPSDPDNVTADAVVRITFGEGIRRATQASTQSGWMRGDVLVNVSRTLELDNRGTGALRLYLAAAARWNDDNMPSGPKKPVTTADEWARAVNQLPTATPDRRRMRDIRERVFAFADELDDKGLAKVTKGARGKLILEPTDEHREAYGKRRKHGAQ